MKILKMPFATICFAFSVVFANTLDSAVTPLAAFPQGAEAPKSTPADTNVIYLRDGQKIENASLVEVGIEEVKYKIGQRATLYVLRKTDIATVFHEDGAREDFEQKPTPVAPATSAVVGTASSMGTLGGGSSALSGACMEELMSLSKKTSFDAKSFFKDLPVAIVKTKAQAKIPKTSFNQGPDPDDKIAAIGITVGCLKAFPESENELTAAIKNVSLKLGLDAVRNEVAVDGAGDGGSDGGSGSSKDRTRFGIRIG